MQWRPSYNAHTKACLICLPRLMCTVQGGMDSRFRGNDVFVMRRAIPVFRRKTDAGDWGLGGASFVRRAHESGVPSPSIHSAGVQRPVCGACRGSVQWTASLTVPGPWPGSKARRADFPLDRPRRRQQSLLTQCEWQASSGSVEEKCPFDVSSTQQGKGQARKGRMKQSG